MVRWAVIISIFYFILLAILVFPIIAILNDAGFEDIIDSYKESLFWIIVAAVSIGQFLLLFLRVKELPKNRKPRARLWGTASLIGLFVCILFTSFCYALIELFKIKFNMDVHLEFEEGALIFIGITWILWMIYFYFFHRNDTLDDYFNRGFSLLLKGSIFELLICIPAHIIVRQRDECCAGFLTGLGLACGFSIMLLCFGPIVLALIYKRVQLKK